MSKGKLKEPSLSIVQSPKNYFTETVTEAMEKRRLEAAPSVRNYIVELLESYLVAANLTNFNTTLAESLLRAQQAQRGERRDMLRRLGDISLYVSGFFGDSLRRKIVDMDYYADIGGTAYAALATELEGGTQASIFMDFANRFAEYVDLLTYISQNTLIQSNQDLLRLYERYVITGSSLAREQLIEKGLIAHEGMRKISNQ